MNIRIAICGIDGAGKTTLAYALNECLSLRKILVNYAKVPFPSKEACTRANFTDGNISDEIVKRVGMAFDYVRYYSSIKIIEGILLCDRYGIDYEILNDIYQLPQEYCNLLHNLYNLVPPPDLYIYLKVNVADAINRLETRGDREFNESNVILEKMDRSFDAKFKILQNVITIDASQPQKRIAEISLNEILKLGEFNYD